MFDIELQTKSGFDIDLGDFNPSVFSPRNVIYSREVISSAGNAVSTRELASSRTLTGL